MSKLKFVLSLLKKSVLILLAFYFNQTFCQQQKEIDTTFNKDSKTFLFVPLITNSPVMETGFEGLGLYFFIVNTKDSISPPSLVSIYAIYTTNKSHIFAPFGRFFWNEDKNRASFGMGNLRINNDFTYIEQGNDLKLVFSEIRNFVSLEYSKKIFGVMEAF
jgi:hypothetical protein